MSCQIAIVGAGPAGLSAAAHAEELGLTYVLLEGSPAHANTLQRYQKGKHVMAEPGLVPLRSALEFEAGSRERVLDEWEKASPISASTFATRAKSRKSARAMAPSI